MYCSDKAREANLHQQQICGQRPSVFPAVTTSTSRVMCCCGGRFHSVCFRGTTVITLSIACAPTRLPGTCRRPRSDVAIPVYRSRPIRRAAHPRPVPGRWQGPESSRPFSNGSRAGFEFRYSQWSVSTGVTQTEWRKSSSIWKVFGNIGRRSEPKVTGDIVGLSLAEGAPLRRRHIIGNSVQSRAGSEDLRGILGSDNPSPGPRLTPFTAGHAHQLKTNASQQEARRDRRIAKRPGSQAAETVQ